MSDHQRTSAPREHEDPSQPLSGRHTGGPAISATTPWPDRVLDIATLATVAVVLLMLARTIAGTIPMPWRSHAAAREPILVQPTPTINPLLIVQPRTVTQSVHLGTLRLALTASPVLPGPNRFIVTLVEHGRVIAVARVGLTAKMLEMPMRPVLLSVQAERDARYVAVGLLSMFGRWQITVHVARRHATPLAHTFALSLDSPAALFQTPVARGSARP